MLECEKPFGCNEKGIKLPLVATSPDDHTIYERMDRQGCFGMPSNRSQDIRIIFLDHELREGILLSRLTELSMGDKSPLSFSLPPSLSLSVELFNGGLQPTARRPLPQLMCLPAYAGVQI